MAVLVIDRACHTDRLVGRAEMGIAADLHRDITAQAAQGGQIPRPWRVRSVHLMCSLARALGRATAGLHDQRRRAEVADDVIQLGRNVTRVEIDHESLHLQHVCGTGLALFGDGAGDDIDRRTLAVRPCGKGRGPSFSTGGRCRPRSRCCGACRPGPDPCRQSRAGGSALAPAEDDIEEDGDLIGVGIAAERAFGRRAVVEVHPRVEVQDAVLAHRSSLQQRAAQGRSGIRRNRRWRRCAAAIRPRRSPAGSAPRDPTCAARDRHRRAPARGASRPCLC